MDQVGCEYKSHDQLCYLYKCKVEIFKHQRLSRGSFRITYKAVCDELLYVAKVLHRTLVDHSKLGTITTLWKFGQECRFMDNIICHCPCCWWNCLTTASQKCYNTLSQGPIRPQYLNTFIVIRTFTHTISLLWLFKQQHPNDCPNKTLGDQLWFITDCWLQTSQLHASFTVSQHQVYMHPIVE